MTGGCRCRRRWSSSPPAGWRQDGGPKAEGEKERRRAPTRRCTAKRKSSRLSDVLCDSGRRPMWTDCWAIAGRAMRGPDTRPARGQDRRVHSPPKDAGTGTRATRQASSDRATKQGRGTDAQPSLKGYATRSLATRLGPLGPASGNKGEEGKKRQRGKEKKGEAEPKRPSTRVKAASSTRRRRSAAACILRSQAQAQAQGHSQGKANNGPRDKPATTALEQRARVSPREPA